MPEIVNIETERYAGTITNFFNKGEHLMLQESSVSEILIYGQSIVHVLFGYLSNACGSVRL
ncbi:hypothetical protein GCM10025778_14350 [Paeniglutamicibacter antarcticus]|uniref:Uncharacterized protein n=1 Tax=Paeniglutamicibacter antarcticus TaxID=494023 RepID=A0ABP9TMF3_9MICC